MPQDVVSGVPASAPTELRRGLAVALSAKAGSRTMKIRLKADPTHGFGFKGDTTAIFFTGSNAGSHRFQTHVWGSAFGRISQETHSQAIPLNRVNVPL
jgi:hypothetical protein